MPERSRRPLGDLPAARFLGHPIVLGVIGFALITSVLSLILTATGDSASPSGVLSRALSVLGVGFAAWCAWQEFLARRRSPEQ